MPLETRKLVVRPQGLRSGPWLWVILGVALALLLWIVFEVGRSQAGYSVTRAFLERRLPAFCVPSAFVLVHALPSPTSTPFSSTLIAFCR